MTDSFQDEGTERKPPAHTDEDKKKKTFADLGQFPLIGLSTCNLSVASQGEGRPSRIAQGGNLNNADNVSETE